MSRRAQLSLLGFERLNRSEFGGSLVRGHARAARPLSFKRPLHVVLRSTRATGSLSFLRPSRARAIQRLVHRLARKNGVRVYRYANSGNHLHLLVRARSAAAYKSFIRSLTGLVARLTLGAEKGRPKGVKFWDSLPFSRIVEWGRAFAQARDYLMRNELEALGFIPYRPRRRAGGTRPPP